MATNLPSFERAEYLAAPNPATPGVDRCALCKQPIADQYYRVNGDMACAPCAQRHEPVRVRDTHAAYSQALLWGVGAAVVGMIGYALFTILTGIMLGYVAIGVGYLIGKAMKRGSKGVGGRRYQIAAVLLTYAAVSIAAVPIALTQMAKKKPALKAPAQPGTSASKDFPYPGDPAPAPAPKPTMSVGAAIALLIALGLASPFMELTSGVQGILGLFILFLGILAAWKQTAEGEPGEADVSGPYECAPPTPA